MRRTRTHCSLCGKTVRDPVIASINGAGQALVCLGCVADNRAAGRTVNVVRRSMLESVA